MEETATNTQNTDKKESFINEVKVEYCSENFVVVSKDYDVRINSDDPSHHVTVETQLAAACPHLVDTKLGHSFRFCHRLDYATSGLLCIALNKSAAKWAGKAFSQHLVKKYYLALVRGHVAKQEGNLRSIKIGIGKDSSEKDFAKYCTEDNPNCTDVRNAHSSIILLEYGQYDNAPATKVLLIPHTGRSHQLRLHCLHIGHCIVGDYTYSNKQDVKPFRMMLHSFRLELDLKEEQIDVITDDPFQTDKDSLWKSSEIIARYTDYFHLPNKEQQTT